MKGEKTMLAKLLAEGRPLLADGATGTNLFEAGLASGESAELWNETHPERIRALHQSFVDAGADIILTNTFGANRRRLALHGAGCPREKLSRLAAEIARAVADRAGRPVVVAGSVGPTGEMLAPLGSLSEDEAMEVFVERSRASKKAAPTSCGSRPCRRSRRPAPRRARRLRSACPTRRRRASTKPAAL